MAITSARNFTVQNNILVGNTSFIGSRGPNCSHVNTTPASQPFGQQDRISQSSLQNDFTNIGDADSLTCIIPPSGGDYWPFGGNQDPNAPPGVPDQSSPFTPTSQEGLSTGAKVGIAIGVIGGVLFVAILAWFIRRRVITRQERNRRPAWASRRDYS